MKTLIKSILSLFLVLVAIECCFAKEWRGLTPLRSTRADVARLLNQCSEQKEACAFTLDNEDVYILFSGGLTDEYGECSRMLPAETVMFIDVQPKVTLKIDSLKLVTKKFKTFNPSEPYKMGLKGYWNENEGLLINTLRGKVIQRDYLAAAADKPICASFYEEPESFIEMVPVHVPVVALTCSSAVRAGERIVASASTNMTAPRGYVWMVGAGTIISGQRTRRITVDTTGLSGQAIVVTAELRDAFAHAVPGTCQVQVQAR
jgi:hypothetical protein